MSLLEMSAAGGVVILAVTAVRAVCLDRLPKGTFLALWAVTVLRLLVPVSVPSPVSVYRLFDGAAQPAVESAVTTPALAANTVPADPMPESAPDPSPEAAVMEANPSARHASIPWRTVVWAAGAAGCGAYFALAYLAARWRFREAVVVDDPFAARWQACVPMSRQVSVRLSGRVKAPMTYGLFRPVILLGADTDWHDRQRMWLVLCHEYAHILRLDGLKKLILTVTVCLHWFNPLVWVMFALANRDIELACDEQVLRSMGGDGRTDYARTLIDMARDRDRAPIFSHFAANAMEERITAIMKTKKRTTLAVAISILLTLGVTAVFAAGAPVAEAPASPSPAPTETTHEITYAPPTPTLAPADPEATEKPRPTEDEVLAARKEALAGMSQEDIDHLTSVITRQNLWWESEYLRDILTSLSDPDDLAWNYFDQTGQIDVSSVTGYCYEGPLNGDEIRAQCEKEGITTEEFYEKYGRFESSTVSVNNKYSVEEIVTILAELKDTAHNEDLRTDLTYLANQIVMSQKTHNMWYVSNLFKMLHDLDYYLLRYGPEDQPSTRPGEPSIVGKYYGMLTILGADHGEGVAPAPADWSPTPPQSPTPVQ